ncbi:heterokaryon incompatibility protein-domain-containing protein [Diplogelasinospora grovesii]|uniref:Heterokaryon incompatibility protein-domain-containing protein n=1 Tax=Diplogelasinospora grovesii TaxID=303347 RepID=A0AAN6MXL6_9PEZI|nr:heterokaryon incompatibility protein-domain-containing protein [Diplogelasinospora grovesii]
MASSSVSVSSVAPALAGDEPTGNQPIYRPLDSSIQEIRLLSFESSGQYAPASSQIKTSCRLHHASLHQCPPFAALSYVWGDPNDTASVMLDGRLVSVGANLTDALAYVKLHWRRAFPYREANSFRLWVDALCINQDDPAERSQQVQFMTDIYLEAELVIAWLGCKNAQIPPLWLGVILSTSNDDTLRCALDSLQLIAGRILDAKAEPIFSPSPRLPIEDRIDKSATWDQLQGVVTWMCKLGIDVGSSGFKRPEWIIPRVWKAITTRGISFSAAINAPQYVRNPGASLLRSRVLIRWQLSSYSEMLLATDPRDYVYGLLALTHIPGLRPDYSPENTPGKVFSEFVVAWLNDPERRNPSPRVALEFSVFLGGELWPLGYSGTGISDPDVASFPDLPSWAPNFAREILAGGSLFARLIGTAADKNVFSTVSASASVNGKSLFASGVILDSIAQVDSGDYVREPQLLNYVHNFIRKHPTYPSGLPPLRAIFECLFRETLYVYRKKSTRRAGEWIGDYDMNDRVVLQHGICFIRRLVFGGLKHAREHRERPAEEFPEALAKVGISTTSIDAFIESLRNAMCPELDVSEHGARLAQWLDMLLWPWNDGPWKETSAAACIDDVYRLAHTSLGYLALVPPRTAVGDKVCVLKGGQLPSVLRLRDGYYEHVGTCYCVGLSQGEAAEFIRDGKAQVEVLELR